MALTPRFNPSQPIPNDPFYYPETNTLSSSAGPLIVGSGISINYASSVISATGGGGGGGVTSVSGTFPIQITGVAAAPVVNIASASTTTSGAVMLNNTTTSLSTSEALTAAMGKYLQDQISALLTTSNLTLAGTYAGTMQSVTAAGSGAGFSVGFNLPAASLTNQDYFVIVTADGSYNIPGVGFVAATKGDWFLSDGVSWQFLDVGPSIPAATTTVQGIVELATVAEANAKIDATRAVTPASLINYLSCTALARGQLFTGTAIGGFVQPWSGINGQVLTIDTTQASGLNWITPTASAIPCACITAKGSLIVGSAASTPSALPVGTLGQVLTVVSTNPTNCLAWCTPSSGIPFTAKGQIWAGTGAGTAALCAAASCGQIVVSDSFCGAGLKWVNAYPAAGSLAVGTGPAGGVTALSVGLTGQVLTVTGAAPNTCLAWCTPAAGITFTAKGEVPLGTGPGACVLCAASGCGQLLISDSLCSGGAKWQTGYFTLGDTLLGVTGGGFTRLALGTNGQVLTACNTCTGGAYWANAAGAVFTAKGQILAGTGGAAYTQCAALGCGEIVVSDSLCTAGVKWCCAYPAIGSLAVGCAATGGVYSLPVGANGTVLQADSTCVGGLKWSTSTVAAATPLLLGTVCGCTPGSSAPATSFGAQAGGGTNSVSLGLYAGRGSASSASTYIGTYSGGGQTSSNTGGSFNTGVGTVALGAVTTGSTNASLGYSTLCLLTTGNANVAIGYNTGCALTTGSSNVLIGTAVQAPTATSVCSLAIGFDGLGGCWLTGDSTKAIRPGAGIIDCAGSCGTAGQVLMSNGANAVCWGPAGGVAQATPTTLGTVFACTPTSTATPTLFGQCAGGAATGTSIGLCAGRGSTGNNNTFVGSYTGGGWSATSTGVSNTAIGSYAFFCATSATNNTVLGQCSLFNATSGGSNVAIGSQTLCALTTSSSNTAVGSFSSRSVTTGANNTALGFFSGNNLTTGTGNIVIGCGAGLLVDTGNNNIVIGCNATASAGGVSNEVTIGNSSNNSYRIYAAGWSNVSDARDKTEVEDLALGLEFVKQLQPRKFVWDYREESSQNGTTDIGLIAQEVLEVQRNAGADYAAFVNEASEEQLMLTPAKFLPVLINAVKELSAKVEALEAKLNG
jgi:hypothetical protein